MKRTHLVKREWTRGAIVGKAGKRKGKTKESVLSGGDGVSLKRFIEQIHFGGVKTPRGWRWGVEIGQRVSVD